MVSKHARDANTYLRQVVERLDVLAEFFREERRAADNSVDICEIGGKIEGIEDAKRVVKDFMAEADFKEAAK